MKHILLIISTGFALFSMFFGSGNLVFPLAVGQESNHHYFWASIGICMTGVLVPLLGALGILLFKGDSDRFFGVIGRPARFWLPFIMLSLLGPFGVVARCITVAEGSFNLVFPNTSLILFSFISCIIIYFVAANKKRIIPLLGSILTPCLIIMLTLVAIFGFWYGTPSESTNTFAIDAFKNGFFQGYQTMDLLAAFFFSSFILTHLEKETSDKNTIWKIFLQSALIGGALLSAVYFALVFLGAAYASELQNIPPQEMLGFIAQKSLGSFSAPIVCTTIVLACFTTAVVLASLFADFLKTRIANNKISDRTAMITTLSIAFVVSTFEFAGISNFLAPILEAIYPALIVLTLMNIASELWGLKSQKWPVYLTLAAKLGYF
jgi:LIVCS family branched-chain amino acid:cation transporter